MIPQVCGSHQDPGRDTSSFVALQSRSRLGCLKFVFVASQSRSRLGYLKFVVSWSGSRLHGIPQVLWLGGQDPGSGIPQICGFSWSGSRLGYLKFVASCARCLPQVLGFTLRIPVRTPQVSWLRGPDAGCGFVVKIIPQVCGFVVKMPVSSLWLRGQDLGWDISSFVASQSRSRLECINLWLRSQDPGCDTSSLVRSRLGSGYLKFVVSWAGSRLGYLKFCGFAVKIPGRIRQVLWLRSQDPGWDTFSSWLCGPEPGRDTSSLRPSWKTSSFLASRSRSRLGYLKFVASWSGPRLEYLKFVASRSGKLRGHEPG